ncbi:peptidylprolyl isomerase [Neobacillus thermocopriae]|uniref:Foldase protein PrsA n=1 Tax=Neobacillus thermocopriae TaxID=1215031 RepID=A0A6B3TRA3_9BACI|nr:peptidylprolyl isomerase [Neobacillus thermocopriae]MED3623035.1 peptidylprolyl isomerase [Neobacillus thermocopriae]MED3714930.1 peptidylprolyl isomerase [Neobacillus thermocopriae]NEX79323.1 peptidylprolyl isomerase PrsA [Neobacillus thermocopriae]
MKKWILALSIAGGVLALSACGSSEKIAESKAGNVTQEELYNAMKDKYGEQALQQLVYEKVLSKKYKITDEELNKKIDQLKEDLGENFELTLQQYGYKNEEDLKKMMKVGMMQEKAAMKDIKVTEKELKEYYENYKPAIKVRHILVADEATANEVKKKLDGGSKFDEVAKEYSTDTASAQNGGELGTINNQNAAQYDEDFIKAAYALKVNEVSAPVKTQFGYHIIQVTDKKEKESYDKMKEEIEYEVKSSKITNDDINKAMKRELKDAGVKIKDKDLKDALEIETSDDK